MPSPAFQHDRYLLKRQVFALTGKFRVYDPMENLVLFSEQKMFRLREDIRVYADESKAQEVLMIKARQIIDFSAAYDVIDALTGQKAGALRRKGWRSLLRDEWEILDANDQPVGMLFEDSMGRALLRRFLLGTFLPQNYDVTIGSERVADIRQRFNLFAYRLDLDFSMDAGRKLDHRMGIAAAILLATVEGKQSSG
jgi:uncharacterized protein YxjI